MRTSIRLTRLGVAALLLGLLLPLLAAPQPGQAAGLSAQVTTLAGRPGHADNLDGTGGDARFDIPTGVALSADGSFALVADQSNHAIRKVVVATRQVTTLAGSPGQEGSANGIGPAARFRYPAGVALSADGGRALVADGGNHTIRHIGELKPGTPLNFRAGTVTMNSITVQWDLNPGPPNNPVTTFRVRTNATATQSQITPTYGASVRSATFSGLSVGTGYYFFIAACNDYGCSPESPMLWVVTPAPPPPAAPSNLHLCGGLEFCRAGYVTLIWDDNANNEDRFEFEWVRAQAGGTPPNVGDWNREVLAANDEGHALPNSYLSSGGLYYFRVRAGNAGGCSTYSNRVDYTAP